MGTKRPPRHNQTVDQMLRGYRLTQMLHVLAKLGIADCLREESQTAAQLAQLVDANVDALNRLLRAVAALGILSEDSKGRFSLTEAGVMLRSDVSGSLRNAAIMYGEPWWWNAWGGLFDAVKTGDTAFQRVHHLDLFDYLNMHPSAAALFHSCMDLMTSEQTADIVSSVDFSSARKLIDVGGGQGALIAAILRANPQITAVLFDSPKVIESSRGSIESLGLADRCEFVGGNFFVSVPSGGDTYVLKDVLHDWDDQRAAVILRHINQAMNGTGRILVIERVIPGGNTFSPGKLVDISMLVLTGGKERTESEYGSLLLEAGFVVQKVTPVNYETRVICAEPS
jgi:hypothetical protein